MRDQYFMAKPTTTTLKATFNAWIPTKPHSLGHVVRVVYSISRGLNGFFCSLLNLSRLLKEYSFPSPRFPTMIKVLENFLCCVCLNALIFLITFIPYFSNRVSTGERLLYRLRFGYRIIFAMGSLRYLRPYWMLHLKNVKYWRVYAKTGPGYQRTEMLYQAWLGGIDRPYTRPRCSHRTPTWLTRKRFALEKPHLTPQTAVEQLFLEFHQKYFAYRGTLRPVVDDLHDMFELVEKPLDMSYACRTLSHLHNDFVVRLAPETFSLFVHAAMKVNRRDLVIFALNNAELLGFWSIDLQSRAFAEGKSSWYKVENGYRLPLKENQDANTPQLVKQRLEEEDALLEELGLSKEAAGTTSTPNSIKIRETSLDRV